MKFQRRSEILKLDGQQVTVNELSAAEFSTITNLPEDDQTIEMMRLSLEGNPSSEEILSWPNTIVTQILSSVMTINGLTDQGN